MKKLCNYRDHVFREWILILIAIDKELICIWKSKYSNRDTMCEE